MVMGPVVAAEPRFEIARTKVASKPTAGFPVWELVIERSGEGGTTVNGMLPLVPRLVVTLTLRAPSRIRGNGESRRCKDLVNHGDIADRDIASRIDRQRAGKAGSGQRDIEACSLTPMA